MKDRKTVKETDRQTDANRQKLTNTKKAKYNKIRKFQPFIYYFNSSVGGEGQRS